MILQLDLSKIDFKNENLILVKSVQWIIEN